MILDEHKYYFAFDEILLTEIISYQYIYIYIKDISYEMKLLYESEN